MFLKKGEVLKEDLSEQPEILEKPSKEERYIISCESDWIIRDAARILAKSRDIPEKNRFYFSKNTSAGRKGFGKEIPKNKEDNGEPLQNLTKYSRLDIIGHGAQNNFGAMIGRCCTNSQNTRLNLRILSYNAC